MKKVLLFTWHFNYNYGALLQCYAIQKYLQKKGYDVEFPSYIPKIAHHMASFFKNVKKKDIFNSIISRLMLVFRYFSFDLFRNKFLNINYKLSSKNKILKNLSEYNTLIVGSDQLWNTNINTNSKIDTYYYLGFVKSKKIKRISLSTCLGTQKQKLSHKYVKNYINRFNFISVRNTFSKKILEKQKIKNINIIPDPIFLHDFKEFKIKRNIKKNILIIYLLDSSNISYVKRIIKKNKFLQKLSIYFISNENITFFNQNGVKELYHLSPQKFIELFKISKFVITDSFHGCVLAIKFSIKFLPIMNNYRSDRIIDLLNTFKLKNLAKKNIILIKNDMFKNFKRNIIQKKISKLIDKHNSILHKF